MSVDAPEAPGAIDVRLRGAQLVEAGVRRRRSDQRLLRREARRERASGGRRERDREGVAALQSRAAADLRLHCAESARGARV